jgi:hypothetical protein
MTRREVAWRVFASEFADSSLEQQGEGEKAPSYLITPLGAKINRIVAVGVITDIQNTGSDEEPLWKARMSDPTGTFYLSAGQFQLEAARELAKLKPPVFAAIIGKFRTYSPEPGVTYVSIRPESVKKVDAKTRDYWVLEACKSLKRRLDACAEASKMDPLTAEALATLGYGDLAEAIVAASAHYGEVDIERYRAMLADSLRYLLPESQRGGAEAHEAAEPAPAAEAHDTVEAAVEVVEDAIEAEMAPSADENKILTLLSGMGKDRRGTPLEDIQKAAKKAGLDPEKVEGMLDSLLDKGLIFEPKIGRYMLS